MCIFLTINSVTTTATYDDQDRLESFGTKSFSHNLNGDLTSVVDTLTSATNSFSYDVFGNLKSVTLPSKSISYKVDAFNRRVVKLDGTSVVEHYIWNSNNQLVGITDSAGVFSAGFIYGSKAHVPDYMVKGPVNYQIVTNHLGSPVMVVDSATGVVAQEIRYDEFGNILSDTNPGFTPFGYAGCLYDVDTQLCRFGVRDYDPSIGRWLSKDPIRFEGGDTNLYGYVMQDPINYIDPTGNIRLVTPFTPFTSFISLITGGPAGLNPNEAAELQRMLQEKRFPATNNPPSPSSFPMNNPPSSPSNVCTPGNTGPTIGSGL
jgi:RHS repeat-associated protein